jgi:hypothetical protein
MNKFSKQEGSAHVAVVAILVIAVIGILGFVFWQNFINQDDSDRVNRSTGTSQDDTPKAAPLLDVSFNQAFGINTSFQHPSDWKLDRTLTGPIPIDENGYEPTNEILKVTSPSGKYSVSYHVNSVGGVGGTCDFEETPHQVAQFDYAELENFQGVSFDQLVLKNKASSTYSYDIRLMRTTFVKDLSAGDAICTTGIGIAGALTIGYERMLTVSANIKPLDDENGNSLDMASIDTITKSFSDGEYVQMKAILLSTKSSLTQV